MTIHQEVAAARRRLSDAGLPTEEADLGARIIAEHLLGWDAARFLTSADEPAPADFAASYEALVARRASREPLAYVIGRQEFWNLSFEVSPAVLIPRPETELIVEAAIELVSGESEPLHVADICTGSGCLAIALARELPRARVVATDISGTALDVARQNARRHGVEGRIDFVRTDLFEAVTGPFAVIVANPPYVRAGDRPGLQPEVRDWEPAVALYGGTDGLDLVERLVQQAPSRLAKDAYLIFEFGFGQEMAVEELISKTSGLKMVDLRRDLQGIARTAVARKT